MKVIGIFLLAGLGICAGLSGKYEKKAMKAAKKDFAVKEIFMEELFIPENREERPGTGLASYTLKDSNEILGYVLITTAKGRHEYFDYLVIYNPDLSIRLIEVLEYRSEYGFEITNKKWLQQFVGLKGCGLVYGDDIDAISGATYSASSITADIGVLCEYIQENLNK